MTCDVPWPAVGPAAGPAAASAELGKGDGRTWISLFVDACIYVWPERLVMQVGADTHAGTNTGKGWAPSLSSDQVRSGRSVLLLTCST